MKHEQARKIMNQDYLDLCELVNWAIHQKEADPLKIQNMNISAVIELARKQSVLSMVYYILSSYSSFIDPVLYQRMEMPVLHLYTQIMKQDYEREQLIHFLEAKQIRYMPLKGVVLKNYYPDPSFREMCDNDILYDTNYIREVSEYFLSRHYTISSYDSKTEDVFCKDEITFEMHRKLIASDRDSRWINYYSNVWDRLIQDDHGQSSYHFSDEDFYIFIMIHAFKHFKVGGMGLRTLTDFYLYLHAHPELNFSYIQSELESLGAKEFEENARGLAVKIFDHQLDLLNKQEKEMLATIQKGNSYEDTYIQIERTVKEKGRLYYIFHRIFPPIGWYEENHPWLYTHQIMIPIYLGYHFMKGIFNGKAFRELNKLGEKHE